MAKDVDGKGDAGKDVDGKGDAGKDVDGKGGPGAQADLVDGILSRATALGGWLIVSIVSPLPSNGSRFASSGTGPSTAMKKAADETAKRTTPSGSGVFEPAAQPERHNKTGQSAPK